MGSIESIINIRHQTGTGTQYCVVKAQELIRVSQYTCSADAAPLNTLKFDITP